MDRHNNKVGASIGSSSDSYEGVLSGCRDAVNSGSTKKSRNIMTRLRLPRTAALALVSGVLLFGSASGEAPHQYSCLSAMIEDRLFGNDDDLGYLEYNSLMTLATSIYEGIHRSGILIGRHIDEAKVVLGRSEPCDRSHMRDGLVCEIYVLIVGASSTLQIYTDEHGIVFKTKIVRL